MGYVRGDTPIWSLSIPGTHDSYTGCANVPAPPTGSWPYDRRCDPYSLGYGDLSLRTTQTLPVPEQLKMGIRGIDLRLQTCLRYNKNPPTSEREVFVRYAAKN
jgi:hypothetical protein